MCMAKFRLPSEAVGSASDKNLHDWWLCLSSHQARRLFRDATKAQTFVNLIECFQGGKNSRGRITKIPLSCNVSGGNAICSEQKTIRNTKGSQMMHKWVRSLFGFCSSNLCLEMFNHVMWTCCSLFSSIVRTGNAVLWANFDKNTITNGKKRVEQSTNDVKQKVTIDLVKGIYDCIIFEGIDRLSYLCSFMMIIQSISCSSLTLTHSTKALLCVERDGGQLISYTAHRLCPSGLELINNLLIDYRWLWLPMKVINARLSTPKEFLYDFVNSTQLGLVYDFSADSTICLTFWRTSFAPRWNLS